MVLLALAPASFNSLLMPFGLRDSIRATGTMEQTRQAFVGKSVRSVPTVKQFLSVWAFHTDSLDAAMAAVCNLPQHCCTYGGNDAALNPICVYAAPMWHEIPQRYLPNYNTPKAVNLFPGLYSVWYNSFVDDKVRKATYTYMAYADSIPCCITPADYPPVFLPTTLYRTATVFNKRAVVTFTQDYTRFSAYCSLGDPVFKSKRTFVSPVRFRG